MDNFMTKSFDEKRYETVEVGAGVIIEKLYGPTVFMDLKITLDRNKCEWVIERRTILPCPDPEDQENTTHWQKWVEWCRIPGQFDWEFEKD